MVDGAATAWTYDLAGRPIQVRDSIGGTITRCYDGFGRLLSETTPQGTVSYTYDVAGRGVLLIRTDGSSIRAARGQGRQPIWCFSSGSEL